MRLCLFGCAAGEGPAGVPQGVPEGAGGAGEGEAGERQPGAERGEEAEDGRGQGESCRGARESETSTQPVFFQRL